MKYLVTTVSNIHLYTHAHFIFIPIKSARIYLASV